MSAIDYTRLSLPQVSGALEAVARDAEKAFGDLNEAQLNWKPDAKRWSVAQCFDHLVNGNRLVFAAAESALNGSASRTIWQRLPFAASGFGRLMIRALEPTTTRKLTAPTAIRPTTSRIPGDIVHRFVVQQRERASWVRALDGTVAAETIMTSPFARFISYSVLDACRLVAAHDCRHFEQARRVTLLPEFPGAGAAA